MRLVSVLTGNSGRWHRTRYLHEPRYPHEMRYLLHTHYPRKQSTIRNHEGVVLG